MPAHIKASLMGPSLTLPVRDGRLALGTWQGIYLCEPRDRAAAARARDAVGRGLTLEPPRALAALPTGSRFSAKAVAPSRASSEPNTGPEISPWRCHARPRHQPAARRGCAWRLERERAVGRDHGGELERGVDRRARLGEAVDEPELAARSASIGSPVSASSIATW